MRNVALSVCLLVTCVSESFGFASGGHRIIGEIAWQQLDETTRVEAVELLKHHPRLEQDFVSKMPDSVRNGTQQLKDHWLFLESSVWPDTTRGLKGEDRQKYHRGPWHYINFPTYLNPDDESLLDLSRVNRSTTFEGDFRDDSNLNIIQAIKANVAGLRDASRTKAQRAVHLCWVMHLVGDAHQPLHSTALFTPKTFPKGCRGGNDIKLEGRGNLHSLWDRLLPYETTVGGVGSATAKILKEAGEHGPRAAKSLEPESWTRESHKYADEFAYSRDVRMTVASVERAGNFGDVTAGGEVIQVWFKPSEEYLRAAGHLARRRAVEAGYRMAEILKMKTEPKTKDIRTLPHPDAVANPHAVGEVDNPELVPFVVANPASLPGIVVDENKATLLGQWQYSTHTPPYVGLGYLHDQKSGKGAKSVTFTPQLPQGGLYEVRLSHCYNMRRAINTPVLIHHADGETTVRINQQETPEFNRLFRTIGKFRFLAGSQGWVRISTEGTDGKYVIADAVQFIPIR